MTPERILTNGTFILWEDGSGRYFAGKILSYGVLGYIVESFENYTCTVTRTQIISTNTGDLKKYLLQMVTDKITYLTQDLDRFQYRRLDSIQLLLDAITSLQD